MLSNTVKAPCGAFVFEPPYLVHFTFNKKGDIGAAKELHKHGCIVFTNTVITI